MESDEDETQEDGQRVTEKEREIDREREREKEREDVERSPRFVLHLLDGKCVDRRRTTNWLVGHESSP